MAKSEVIYDGRHYSACAMRDGSLVVQRKSARGGGVRLVGDTAASWIDFIRTAIDGDDRAIAAF